MSYQWTENVDRVLLHEDMIDHRSYTHSFVNLKPEKNSGLNGIRTHDLCDTDAVLYQVVYITTMIFISFRRLKFQI